MSLQEKDSAPLVRTPWIAELLRKTLLSGINNGDISHWAYSLVELLREHKPDHEIHIFGVNRTPKLPNFFLASSTEKFVKEEPLLINVTKKTAELFLPPVANGIRVLQEEMPMTVLYNVNDPPKRVELPFYDAICFDTEQHSIIMGLIVTECTVEELVPEEELNELQPIVQSYAMPLIEALTLRHIKEKQDEDIESLLKMMRESHPDIANVSIRRGEHDFVTQIASEKTYDSSFLQYLTNELRSPLSAIVGTSEKLLELSNTSMGSPELHELATAVHFQTRVQEELLRCLNNIAMLSATDVKPRRGVFPMQGLIREIYPLAVQIAGRYSVQIKLQEHTRNIFIAGDQKTLVKMIERLLGFTLFNCQHGNLWIQTDDDPERIPKGCVALEFEDSGEVPKNIAPSSLLDPSNLGKVTHPRVRRGGGLLLTLLSLYMQKSGGELRAGFGENDGFRVSMILPLVSRSEMEKIKAGEITS